MDSYVSSHSCRLVFTVRYRALKWLNLGRLGRVLGRREREREGEGEVPSLVWLVG